MIAKVIADSSVWSLLVRRKPQQLNPLESAAVAELSRLLLIGGVILPGAVRQELLSGVREPAKWAAIVGAIDDLIHELATRADHDLAATYFNRCAEIGVAATNYDMLICAIASRLKMPIFSTDADFGHYAKCLPIKLHKLPG